MMDPILKNDIFEITAHKGYVDIKRSIKSFFHQCLTDDSKIKIGMIETKKMK